MLELIAEKQKQLGLLIKVEEFAAAEVFPFRNFLCVIAGKLAGKEGFDKGIDYFFKFILSTKGITWQEGVDYSAVPFHEALGADYIGRDYTYAKEDLWLFRAVWVDFMILVLEDEILELMEAESLWAESSVSS